MFGKGQGRPANPPPPPPLVTRLKNMILFSQKASLQIFYGTLNNQETKKMIEIIIISKTHVFQSYVLLRQDFLLVKRDLSR